MLQAFNTKYNLDLMIEPYEHEEAINLSLSSVYDLNDKLEILPFVEMMKELK